MVVLQLLVGGARFLRDEAAEIGNDQAPDEQLPEPQSSPLAKLLRGEMIGAPRGTRTHDPLIKKNEKSTITNSSKSENFPGLNELAHFWGL